MNKNRKILKIKKINVLEDPVYLEVYTKCPEKWILVDLETFQIYRGSEKLNKYGKWKRIFKGFKK